MRLSLSDDQRELQSTVRRFLEAKAGTGQPAPGGQYDDKVWQQLAGQLGLASLIVPERHGGSGFSAIELSVVLEELGRALTGSPLFATAALAAQTILASGDEPAMQAYLPAIAAGAATGTVALYEAGRSWNATELAVLAETTADGWLLTGTKSHVIDGQVADLIIVSASTAAGVGLFLVDSGAPGLRRVPVATLDPTRQQASLMLERTPARLLGADGGGREIISRVLDLAAVALAAEQVGGAQRCLEMSVDYAKLRVQFGRPIGSFQAIKHKCADMLIAVESARSLAYYAAGCAADDPAELPAAASLAKAYCSEAYFRVAADNIQIHGGIGFTWEHPAHLHYRRAKSSELLFGGPAEHRDQLSRRLAL